MWQHGTMDVRGRVGWFFAAYRIPTLKDVEMSRVSNLVSPWMHKEWFLAKAGTSYHQQGLKILMAVKPPFLSSDTEFLNHFSNPSVSKKLPESFGNGHGSLCKKIDCCCDSLFRYSRAQGYPMIPEHRWIHGSMGLADGSSRGCRDVSSTFSKKAVRRGWKTYSQSVD